MRPSLLRTLPLVLILTAFFPVWADAAECGAGRTPGATLLFPYFEVDLANPAGPRTLISIQNMSAEPVLTNVVVWTQCGPPVLAFNVALEARANQSIDLYSLLVLGSIPAGNAETVFPDCNASTVSQGFDAAQRARIRARLTGQPDPVNGLCYSQVSEPADLAIGYVTVDVVEQCSKDIRTPYHEGYFTRDGVPGIASSRNVLWGDFFFIDDQQALAQGFEAVSIVAEAPPGEGMVDTAPKPGFYRVGDDRRQLHSGYRTRFFEGGGFDGGTELLVWVEPFVHEGFMCSEHQRSCDYVPIYRPPATGGEDDGKAGVFETGYLATGSMQNERGEDFLEFHYDSLVQSTANRFAMSAIPHREHAEVPRAGSVELTFQWSLCLDGVVKCPPMTSSRSPIQAWVQPIYTAAGRFSVGLNAAALDGTCPSGSSVP